ncbi:chitinase 10-like [Panicum miliaceum]|uniref:chitinase n=1 Tax=Panicum miliaceum TaxID=4540 RepID=A0A3L6T1K3_PANMI|nr:chitinase 10-like [Panicum miliaceum]
MARLFLPPIFLLAGLLAIVSNAGVAEAWWWSGWRWDCLFPSSGRGHGQSRSHVASIVTEDVYRSFFLHKDDAACPARGFYNYTSFLRAAEAFPEFGGDGDAATRKREVAAFLAQISHETTGGWATAPDGPFAWGLCFKEEISPPSNYCDASNTEWPCFPGKSYHGRGPIQLSWNFNYGPAGKALGFDGLRNPEVVAVDPDVAFKTALWFWMTPRAPKPSCHDVMVGRYKPSPADLAANRTAGFGLTTNIINGGIECGPSGNPAPVGDRVGFFRRYCGMLGVDVGPNLDCARQEPYSS